LLYGVESSLLIVCVYLCGRGAVTSLDDLRSYACSDAVKALALFTYVTSSSDYIYTNVKDTLRFLGVTPDRADELYDEVRTLVEKYLKGGQREDVEDVVRECLDKLGIVGEAKKRINALSDEERKILKVASLGVMKLMEKSPYSRGRFSSEYLAQFVSVMISKDVNYDYLEGLFIKTLLAVKDYSGSPYMELIPSTTDIIIGLAKGVESELPNYDYIYSKLRYDAEPFQIAALYSPDRSFYEAIYGYRVEDILNSMVIEKIVFKGVKNQFVDKDLGKAVKVLAQEYSHDLMVNYIVNALESAGYEVNLKHSGFSELSYCCRYTAMRPGVALYIYVCPFAIRPPDIDKGERAIVVVEGVGAKLPEYLEGLKGTWRANLLNALWLCIYKNKVYVIGPTVKEDWQEEVVEALKKSYRDVHVVGATEVVKERPPTPTIVTTAVKEVSIPIPSGPIQSREVLESIVAQALGVLGFNVQTNTRRSARRGASIEVDVWAEKRVGDTRFKVYVSCKNWNRDVDRPVIDEEFGRVFNLQEVPHLRILVVKSMTGPAKGVAEADGFFVIELREKATEANAKEVYELIYRKLSDLFTSIAPPQLLEIASKVNETAKELSKIAQELAKLSQSYR